MQSRASNLCVDTTILKKFQAEGTKHSTAKDHGKIWQVLYLVNEPFQRNWRILIWRLRRC